MFFTVVLCFVSSSEAETDTAIRNVVIGYWFVFEFVIHASSVILWEGGSSLQVYYVLVQMSMEAPQ